jgi:hypothetical protein
MRQELIFTCKLFYDLLKNDKEYLKIVECGNKNVIKFINHFCKEDKYNLEVALSKNDIAIIVKNIACLFKINDVILNNLNEGRQEFLKLNNFKNPNFCSCFKQNFYIKSEFLFNNRELIDYHPSQIVNYFNLKGILKNATKINCPINMKDGLERIYCQERKYELLVQTLYYIRKNYRNTILINLNEIIEKDIKELPKIIAAFSDYLTSFYNDLVLYKKCDRLCIEINDMYISHYYFHKEFAEFIENKGGNIMIIKKSIYYDSS